jgi:hypothetical protein
MPEPIEQTPDAELVTLRKVNADLLKTKHEQKARITALEADVLAATEKADKATASMRATVIDLPLSRMVQQLAPNVHKLLLKEMQEDFAFEAADDGSIVIKSKADGKEVRAKDGKPVSFDKHSLHCFLTGFGYVERSERQKLYAHLLGIPVASGGIGRKPILGRMSNTPAPENKPELQFGLR